MSCFPVLGDIALNADETDFATCDGLQRIANESRAVVESRKGSYRYDLDFGLLPFEAPRVTPAEAVKVAGEIADGLREISGVQRVVIREITIDQATRNATIHFDTISDFGTLADQASTLGIV